ncbi:putative ABC transport system permease protein [Pseudarcicella hirudinis]|uniref:Putative ABC transport system permease protein n=1 Tax=Pseudarcicella hirudinis TaxID=1079859 RepID=A0A1I5TZ70_9BACT|nr:FtsX-like permease family protein [Pseudarcicella hirudinis]SFP87917.1 putative ABC transport system permease protein [Pseudarcicella hirudinis]
MLKHLFKLIWKKKKSNFLMMLEIFVSFLILFAVWSLSVYNYRNYAQPSGLDSENVWAVFLNFNTDKDSLKIIYKDLVRQKLKSHPEVEAFSFSSSNLPYSFSSMNNGFTYKKKDISSQVMEVDPDYTKVLKLSLAEGRWFTEADKAAKIKPLIITRHLKEALFGNENALGKITGEKDDRKQVIGIVECFKYGNDFQKPENCAFTPSGDWQTDLLIRVKPGTSIDSEAKIAKEISQLGKDWSLEIQHLDKMKATKNRIVWVPILILLIVCGFLIFNVALGLFGVLFQTISHRKQEIGVRRAIGATKSHILWQFIGETLVIATFGLTLGIFFAMQFPLLNVFDVDKSTYLLGILFAVITVYLLVITCALFPSRQASQIYPAVALHEE